MKSLLVLFLFSLAMTNAAEPPPIPSTPAQEKAHPPSVPLWAQGAPGSESRKNEPESVVWRQEPDIVFPVTANIHHPSVTPYLPLKNKSTGTAVIIAPGGGHMFLTTDREGYDLAEWLADRGIAAFVLKYRLARDRANPADQTQPYKTEIHAQADALRAVQVVRAHAEEWAINPARVGIIGFSAGGEVALLAALHHNRGQPSGEESIDRLNSRPDFAALIYPGGLNGAIAVSPESTPPLFLTCTYDDFMTESLASFFIQLKKAGVNAELHIYNRGGHGFGVRPRGLAVSGWPTRFVEWMRDRGFLKAE